MDYKVVMKCRVCGSANLREYLDLGFVPLCNSLLDSPEAKVVKYPLQVLLCQDCSLSQLSVVIDPKILYSQYAYHSSVSETFKRHCYDLALKLKAEFKVEEYPLVVDIASNDGCLLKQFKSAGFHRFLGIDPAKNLMNPYKAIDDFQDAIPTVNDFWSDKLAHSYMDGATQKASFIIAQNVFAHVDDLNDFLRGVHWFLDDRGVFVVEVPYLVNLIRFNQFDTIYHEHLSYFLLKPLMKLFAENGLPIFKVEEHPIHGGSIRIYASKGAYQEDDSIDALLEFEDLNGFYQFETYERFARKVETVKEKFSVLLELLYHSNKKVMGYGASAKGISLLNYCKVPKSYIHSIVDETLDKQGKFTPGSSIPIVDFTDFYEEKPDFILLLAWNFAEELMAKTKGLCANHIVPIPEFKLI